MEKKAGITIFLVFLTGVNGFTQGFYPPQAQDRVTIKGDPDKILAGWGPMGYFNQFYDPSNIIGPEILKGFGVPFAAYNGFNLMETMTTPPLVIPEEATSTVPPEYNKYPDLFAPTSDPVSVTPQNSAPTNYGYSGQNYEQQQQQQQPYRQGQGFQPNYPQYGPPHQFGRYQPF